MSDETWVKWDYLFIESYDHVVKQVWGRCAADKDLVVDFPQLDSVRGDFEVLSQRPLRPGTSQGRVVTGKEYVITAFTVGDWWRLPLWGDLEGWAQKAGLQEV
jgi:hypothetical protein